MCQILSQLTTNTTYHPNAAVMLVHRLRRWPNITAALGQYMVFVDYTGYIVQSSGQ